MESFSEYFKSLLKYVGYKENIELTIPEIRNILSKTNEYFYTYKKEIGKTLILDEYYDYFSEFHKFWEKYHKQILNPTIDEHRCKLIAEILNEFYISNGQKLFYELYDTFSLEPQEICQIRYFSANQDFRGSRDF